jgi:hypothetical protein
MAFVFTAIAVAATVADSIQSKKAGDDARKQASLDNARERARALARARVARGSSENAAALSGAVGGSSAAGALASVSATTATAIGNQQQSVALGNRIARRTAQSELYAGIGQLSGQFIKPRPPKVPGTSTVITASTSATELKGPR